MLSREQTKVGKLPIGASVYLSGPLSTDSWGCLDQRMPSTLWPCPWDPKTTWKGAGPQILIPVTQTSEIMSDRHNQQDRKKHLLVTLKTVESKSLSIYHHLLVVV